MTEAALAAVESSADESEEATALARAKSTPLCRSEVDGLVTTTFTMAAEAEAPRASWAVARQAILNPRDSRPSGKVVLIKLTVLRGFNTARSCVELIEYEAKV
jgi:hypothetical protein